MKRGSQGWWTQYKPHSRPTPHWARKVSTKITCLFDAYMPGFAADSRIARGIIEIVAAKDGFLRI